MGAEIDRLEVQVEAQATKANNQLDKLVGKLDRVSGALSNLNSSGLTGLSDGVTKFAQASSQLSNVKTTDFTRLTKNIDKLANLNTQQIVSAASAIVTLSNAVNSLGSVSANSMQVVDVANSIGKLGSASVQKAITNLPALATAMNDLMATLAKAPSVNRNIIDMTNSLANLAAQGAKVGTAGSSLTQSVNSVGNVMSANTKKANSFASAIGKVYQKYFLLIRGAKKLWTSIEGSMNYVETLNYFDAAFGQVAESAVSQWEAAGASSADSYYESFSSRAKELTSKMTGFTVNDDGTLTASGAASLGINPSQLMNYQATFAQMSSSMGVASETSLLLSQALTEIGADLASVKNMDFDKVWTDMASGLAGMSRTLDKYGVNIRNVNLQQKLFDLGIEENITNLNQNDKALLRAIILLDSTKYAWGDLADTLNQPANQLRLLESNFSNLSRIIGNLFLPAVSRVLPYVNGLVIGLQRLFTWIGNLLGIDLSGITSAVGDSAVDIGELIGETDDLTGSLGEAAKAADKLNKGIRSFDELNVITTQTDSDSTISGAGLPSGLLDSAFEAAFEEYQKAWDEAFANMENRANEFADKVEEFLQPVRDIIEDFAIGDFFKAGQDTSNLVAGIFNFFADAIDNVDWYAIGENIGDYLAGINWTDIMDSVGNVAWEALKAAVELWSGMFEEAPIETLLITFGAIGFKLGYLKLTKDLFKKALADAIGLKSTFAGGFTLSISATLIIAWTLKNLLNDENSFIRQYLDKNAYSEEDRETYKEFDNFTWTENIKKNIEEVKQGFTGLFDFGDKNQPSIFEYYGEKLSSFLEPVKNNIEEVKAGWRGLFDFGETEQPSIFEYYSEKVDELGANIKSGLSEKWLELTNWWENTGIPNWWNNGVIPWTTKEKWMSLGDNIKGGLSGKWTEFTNWWKSTGFYTWWNNVEKYFDKKAWTWDGIKEGLSESWNAAIDSIKGIWNTFANWLNDKLVWDIDPISVAGNQIFGGATINLGKIPTFSLGGFPEDGWFRASKGEYFGQFDDGTSYIANNNQIVDGVAVGVEEAAYRGMMRALAESGGVTIHVEGDSSGMYRVWKEEYRSEATRLQKNPVPIF